jgi:hypothetical protein
MPGRPQVKAFVYTSTASESEDFQRQILAYALVGELHDR